MRLKCSRRSGFILAITLLVLSITVMLTVGFARFSLITAIQASQQESRARIKWGNASCQRFALEQATRLLKQAPASNPSESLARSECFVELGGSTFQMLLADESAKVNLNQLAAVTSMNEMASIAGRLVGDRGLVTLRPVKGFAANGPSLEIPLASWDQVFRGDEAERLVARELIRRTESITLWSGRLRPSLAADLTIFETLRPAVGSTIADRFIRLLRDAPQRPVADLIKEVSPSERAAEKLSELLADQSDCYSIWVNVVNGGRVETSLAVRRYFSSTLHRTFAFSW
jgi:hypothetical protein